MDIRDVKIAVLMGGIGSERQVSLESGSCIVSALREAGLEVISSDITPDDLTVLDDSSIDVFFLALHGKFGEDGQLQKILEEKSLVYTGSGPEASKLAFDKMASKESFRKSGIAVPEAIRFKPSSDVEEVRNRLLEISDRFVVKPVEQGSSVGIELARGVDDAVEKAKICLREFGDCMIEELISGREFTVGVLFDRTLPIIEIRSNNLFYDYKAKYEDETTGFLFDTIEDKELMDKIDQAAIDCFRSLDCEDYSRVDFLLSGENEVYPLEVNTLPGFTSHSLLPMAAERAGLTMPELCVKIVEHTLAKRN